MAFWEFSLDTSVRLCTRAYSCFGPCTRTHPEENCNCTHGSHTVVLVVGYKFTIFLAFRALYTDTRIRVLIHKENIMLVLVLLLLYVYYMTGDIGLGSIVTFVFKKKSKNAYIIP